METTKIETKNKIYSTLKQNYIIYKDKKIGIIIDKNMNIWFNAK